MKAIAYSTYGGPDVMEVLELPEPNPTYHQVLIKVVAVGLNPVDAMQRQGRMKMLLPLRFPQIAGNELSGVVVGVGRDVSRFVLGDAVVAHVQNHVSGTLAELVALEQDLVAPEG